MVADVGAHGLLSAKELSLAATLSGWPTLPSLAALICSLVHRKGLTLSLGVPERSHGLLCSPLAQH